jgi:hexosaminidase
LKSTTFVPWKFYPKGTEYEPKPGNGTQVSSISVKLVPSKSASGEIDESYTLDLTKNGAISITAATGQGALHALTSLSQLFYQSASGAFYSPLAPVSIKDAPKFSWRGLNIDIARNFEPPSNVKRLIDGLAYNKFNRLHIHATDSQSWPLVIPSLPDLAAKGAYQPNYVWTPQDLEDVQSYAVARGIMPVIEIDSPGHTASIAYSQPDLIAAFNHQPWPTFCNEPPCGQAKLNNPSVLNFFDTLAADLYPRVKSHTTRFHTGGDELNAQVYTQDPGVGTNDTQTIRKYLQQFVSHLHSKIHAAGLHPIVWEEMIVTWNLTLTNDTLVQTWLGDSSLDEVTSKGYQALFGEYNWWYLDCGFGQWVDPNATNPQTPIVPPYTDYCNPYKSWREIYAYNPTANLTAQQQELVIGGEAHMWGELTDPSNLDGKVWPRASAAAEVLWSGPTGPKGVNETVTRRLADMRERLVSMGFAASVVQMTWCLQNIGSCSQ